MSLQQIKSPFSFATRTLKKMSLPLGIMVLFSTSTANALNSHVPSLGTTNNPDQPIKLITQNSPPPDVVVDSDPKDSRPNTSTSNNTDARFTCEFINGEYTVMYNPESQPNKAYPWAIPSKMGGNWTPENRCYEISRRLESYRGDGLLELKTSFNNGYDIICVTTQKDPNCRIVLTVPRGQDPELTRDRIFENLIVADSGQQTTGVNTFVNGNQNSSLGGLEQLFNGLGGNNNSSSSSDGINLKPFLDPADGGNGSQLRSNQSILSNPSQLNPESFR